jgi:biofilm PGA synthesis N-glycosyltransferase PgaC
VTAIVPAFNEADSVVETIESLRAQTTPPVEIIVVDDCSEDRTGELAREHGARVLRPAANTGSKAGAQTFALPEVQTILVLALDADTVLAPDAIERMAEALDDPEVAAASGFVLPRRIRTLWERGRYVEYLFTFSFLKQIQDYYESPLISSGCFSIYRVSALRALFIRVQLRRWSHGFVQNVRLHWHGIAHRGYLRSLVAVACWDAVVASIAFLIGLPILAALVTPFFLLGYIIDAPAVLIPVMLAAARRRELRCALISFPCYYVLRVVGSAMMVKAIWLETVMRKPLLVYEKGH